MDPKPPDNPQPAPPPGLALGHKFPGGTEAPAAALPTSAPAGSGGHFFQRVVLPLFLFVVVIGILAWVTQYLPSWRERPGQIVVAEQPQIKLLEFPEPFTIWERDAQGQPTGYVQEFEPGVEGHADFLFHNVSDGVVEMGLLHKPGCSCANVEVFVSDRSWAKMPTVAELGQGAATAPLLQDPVNGVMVPKGAYGLVRQVWKGRLRENPILNLRLTIWMQPQGKEALRAVQELYTPAVLVPPLQFIKDKVALGVISDQPARGEFWCWSATRDELDLQIAPMQADPCFVYQLRPLDAKERQALAAQRPKEQANMRLRSGFQVSVTVYGQKDGKQLDQGPFHRHLPLLLDGFPLDRPPSLMGLVRGDVDILGLDSVGKVNLQNFPVSSGCSQDVTLLAPADMALALVGHQPAYLDVKLIRNKPEAGGRKMNWTLKIQVPRGRFTGPLPEDSAVLLRTGAMPPRFIRIPLAGNAVQG